MKQNESYVVEMSVQDKHFPAVSTARVFQNYQQVDSMAALEQQLIMMAEEQGNAPETAAAATQQIMASVSRYHSLFDQAVSGAHALPEQLQAELDQLSPDERMDLLQQLCFGFEMAADDDLLASIDDAEACQARYRAAMETDPEALVWSAEKEQALRTRLMQYTADLRLSRKGLKRMEACWGKSRGYVATAAALGYNGYALKCIAAMDLYLGHSDLLTPVQAAVGACREVDMEAVADSVHRGEMAESIAAGLLNIIMLVALVAMLWQMGLGVTTLMEAGTISAAGYVSSIFTLLYCLEIIQPEAIVRWGARQVGKLTAGLSGLLTIARVDAAAALHRIFCWTQWMEEHTLLPAGLFDESMEEETTEDIWLEEAVLQA